MVAFTNLQLAASLADAHRLSMPSGSLCVLPTDAKTPKVSQTAVGTNLSQTVQVLAKLEVEIVRNELRILAIPKVFATIEKPLRDLKLKRILNNRNDALDLCLAKLTRPACQVDIGLPANEVCKPTPDALD